MVLNLWLKIPKLDLDHEQDDPSYLPGPSSRLTGLVWGGPMLGSSKDMEGREGREMREERVVTGGRLVVVGTWKPKHYFRKYKKHKYKVYE